MSQPSSEEMRRLRTDDRRLWNVVLGVYGYPTEHATCSYSFHNSCGEIL
jgi:hypothetical protein